MELIALIVVSALALAGVGGLVAGIVLMGGTIRGMGVTLHKVNDQLIANSDHQVRRIELEQVATGMNAYQQTVEDWKKHAASATFQATNYVPPTEDDGVSFPDRSAVVGN